MSVLARRFGLSSITCVLLSQLTLCPIFCEAASDTNLLPLAVWDTMSQVTTGFGYRENILRSSIAPESSAFLNASADVSLLRFTESGAYASLFLLFDETEYFDAPSVDYERFISGAMQAETPIGMQDFVGGQFNGFYQHQVMDLSETQTIRSRMLVDGYTCTLSPYWKHVLGGGWAVQFETAALRQLYSGDDLSDYWAPAAGMRLIRSYGYRSEISLNGQTKYIGYDSRNEYNHDGQEIPATSLAYQQNEAGVQWRHSFDKEQHWRTTSKLSYMSSQDSGSGYFDYRRVQLSQQMRWKNPLWEVKSNARFCSYNYPEQDIGEEQFERSSIVLDLRIERRLGKRWLLYSSAEQEWNMSNDALEQYNVWTVGAGAGYEF